MFEKTISEEYLEYLVSDFLYSFLGWLSEYDEIDCYYPRLSDEDTFSITNEKGVICTNELVYEKIRPYLEDYNYQLNDDNAISRIK